MSFKIMFQAWRNVFRVLAFAAMWLIAACAPSANAPSAKENQRKACEAAGEAVIQASQALGENCWALTARLNELVKTNPDCKAYFGDKPVNVGDVCK